MAASETADVPDLRLGEMRGGVVVELLLGAGAEAGRTVAEEDLLALVFLLQEVIKRDRPQGEGIAEEEILPEGVDRLGRFSRALGLGGLDHAFKKVRLEAAAEGKGTEILGHGGSPWKIPEKPLRRQARKEASGSRDGGGRPSGGKRWESKR
jgi:hypothetical protein